MEEFLNPKKTLEQLYLREHMVAADFGSGSGGWAIPLAQCLKKGKVFAIDILEEPLSALRSKAQLNKIFNIETVRANVESQGIIRIKIGTHSCDLVLMTNLLFELKDKLTAFSEAEGVLKDNGKILVVDWKKDAPVGPEFSCRVSAEEAKKIARGFGFRPEKEFEAGKYHYGLVFIKE